MRHVSRSFGRCLICVMRREISCVSGVYSYTLSAHPTRRSRRAFATRSRNPNQNDVPKCPLLRRVIEPIIIITNRAHSHYFVMARTGDSRANKATAPSDRAEATRSRSKRREDWQAIKSSFKDALSPFAETKIPINPGPSSSTEIRCVRARVLA